MSYPIQISFLNTQSSEAVEHFVHQQNENLARFYPRITSVTVAIGMPHKHHQKDNAFQVRIDIAVPGKTLCVETDAASRAEYQDVYVAIRDAFFVARRRLEDYAHRKLDAPKRRAEKEALQRRDQSIAVD
ncbi:MAG TPA: HPF/RaiA family ribosome-associated protein [Drouetiella sp.]